MLRPSPIAVGDFVRLLDVDLQTILDTYEVTAVPGRTRPSLTVVWSEPDEVVVESDGPLTLAILDDYRITRVPKAS
jgi:hypothetical protein